MKVSLELGLCYLGPTQHNLLRVIESDSRGMAMHTNYILAPSTTLLYHVDKM